MAQNQNPNQGWDPNQKQGQQGQQGQGGQNQPKRDEGRPGQNPGPNRGQNPRGAEQQDQNRNPVEKPQQGNQR